MNYLDAHCHLTDEAFRDDLDDVLKRMVENHVTKIMLACCRPDDYELASKLYYPGLDIDLCIGIHPEDQKIMNDVFPFSKMEEYAKKDNIKAIGEIGLDYYWNNDNKEAQKELFIAQIKLAQKYHKPIVVHSRDAIEDTYEIMNKYRVKGFMHCFSGSQEMALKFVKSGYLLSFGGPLTYKNARHPKEAAKAIPLSYILSETDSPYLPPVPHRGERNEPSYVCLTVDYLAELRGISSAELNKAINANYNSLFREQV